MVLGTLPGTAEPTTEQTRGWSVEAGPSEDKVGLVEEEDLILKS